MKFPWNLQFMRRETDGLPYELQLFLQTIKCGTANRIKAPEIRALPFLNNFIRSEKLYEAFGILTVMEFNYL